MKTGTGWIQPYSNYYKDDVGFSEFPCDENQELMNVQFEQCCQVMSPARRLNG